jgi:ATP-dependent RNA helicase SUPV3L1/SUV3
VADVGELAASEAPETEAGPIAAAPENVVAEPVVETEIVADAAPAEAAPQEPVAEATPASQEAPAEAAAPESTSAEVAVETAAATAETEEKPILLWRQARFDRQRGGHRHDNRQRAGQARNARAGGQGEAGDGKAEGKPRFDRSRFKPRPGERPQGEGGSFRDGKPQGERAGGRPGRKGGRPDGAEAASAKPAFQPKPREERPARFDPDSPFAKLAALRDQLKK